MAILEKKDKIKCEMYLLPSMKVNSKWIRDLSVKNKQTVQLLEESREEFLFTLKKKNTLL